MATDAAAWMKNLLNNNYDASRVVNRIRPEVKVVYDVRRQVVRQSNQSPAVVFIYTGDMKEEYVDFRRDFNYRYYTVTVDVRYGPIAEGNDMQAAHTNMQSVADEVRRVIQVARKNPNINRNIPAGQTGASSEFTHIYFKGWTDLSNKSIRLFRYVSDVDVRTVVETVPDP